jgi:hypothetical protein
MNNFFKFKRVLALYALLLLCSWSQFTFGQTLRVTTTTYKDVTVTDSLYFTPSEASNYIYGNLNFSSILSGYMIDKSLERFTITAFDGLNGNDSTLHSMDNWFGIYSPLQRSGVNSSATLPTADSIQHIANSYPESFGIPLLFLNHSFQYIKSDALINGLFTTNSDTSILYDNPARTISPYATARVFAGSVFKYGGTITSSGEVKFILPAPLALTDTTTSNIQVDFGDGTGYQNVSPDVPILISYGSSGTKAIKFKQGARISTAEIQFIKDEYLQVAMPDDTTSNNLRSNSVNTLNTTPNDGADYKIFLGCDQTLNKPVLLVEGLAVQSPSNIPDLFRDFDPGLTNNHTFNRLQQLGYDIVVVKFRNNSASIFSNAAALENVIIKINSIKAGTEKLSIIGSSMGGVITKYCLKDMEDRSVDHNVQTFISLDSPHQGANVPSGLQSLLDAAGSNSKIVADKPSYAYLMSVLKSTAAKQLLTQNIFDNTNVRGTFASTYASKGYPALSNNYAISDGREDGTGLGYPAGGKMMELAGTVFGLLNTTQMFACHNTFLSPLSIFTQNGIITEWPFSLFTKIKRAVVITIGSSSLNYESEPGSVINAHVTYGDQTVQGIKDAWGNATVNYFGREQFTFVPTVSALDLNNQNFTQSGDYYPRNPFYNISTGNIKSNHITPFDDYITIGTAQTHTLVNQAISTFIIEKINGSAPTQTCIDQCLLTPVFTANSPICINQEDVVTVSNYPNGYKISWTVPTGVTILSGQGTNQIHYKSTVGGNISIAASFNLPSCSPVAFSKTIHIIGGSTPPTAVLTQPNKEYCNEATVTANPVADAVSYDWLATGDVLINESYTSLTGASNQVTISGSTGGTIMVRANYGSCGVSDYYELCFTPCNGSTDPMTVSNSAPLRNEPISAQVQEVEGATAYLWYTDGDFRETTTDPYWQTTASCGDHNISCVAQTDCGISHMTSFSYWSPCSGFYAFYPNPASNTMTISSRPPANTTLSNKASARLAKGLPFNFKLIDQKGKILKEGNSKGEDINFDINKIPNGNYIMHINTGSEIIKKQVVIKH